MIETQSGGIMSKDIADNAFNEFFNLLHKKTSHDNKRSETNKRIIAEKNEILIPIRKLLARLMDVGLFVEHQGHFDPLLTTKNFAPQEFKVWENESSPHFQPGSSIYFDHPIAIEIAVPNMKEREAEGIIKINCSTPHPLSKLLSGPFFTPEDACAALVQVLSRTTIRVEREQ